MKKITVILCIMIMILSGCGEKPSPEETNPPITSTEEPDLTQLKADLTTLTQKPRPIGSEGEAEAVSYLKGRFESMGYTVSTQKYVGESGAEGSNVIAVKEGSATNDILVISAHHDSLPNSYGANDDASGVAALLLIAEQMKSIDSDTELRFISFTDEENGKNGSRYYVESLPENERERIVGCIQLDMLGGLGTEGTMVCTTDGTSNWLGDLLMGQDESFTLGAETASDHAIFQLAKIPSVLVMQNGQGYLYHSSGDVWELLNQEEIYKAASVVGKVVQNIASVETASYQELAKEQAGNYFYRQRRQSKIFYYASRQENEAYLGFTGKLADSWEDVGEFWHDTYEVYQYDIGWFGGENPMTTNYLYRNGYLDAVEILPSENGYTTEELCELITNTHGEPQKADADNRKWDWQDEIYSKYISLYETDGKPVISVYNYSVGIGNTLATYDVIDGNTKIDDPMHVKVWELLCKALPEEYRQKIGQFQLFTDGHGNILAYTYPMGERDDIDNSRFCVTVDYYDVYDENGNPRDWSKLLYTLIHEYGHVLLESDTQIDLTVGNDTHDPAGFIEDSVRQRFYEEYWQDPYTSILGSYEENPENYVSRYGANLFHEDIADTFAVFVFGNKPEGNTIAEQKIRFFWNDNDMVALRAAIRAGIGLE